MKNKSGFLFSALIVLAAIFLMQSCGRNKTSMQNYVNNYLGIIKNLKSDTRVGIIKKGAEAIIAYRKSGFTDIDNAERAKNALIDGISLDSIALQNVKTLKSPDPISEGITKEFFMGISSTIQGNVIFASNYSKAKDQNIEERKETILNIRFGMRYLAEGLSSMVTSIEKLQLYIHDNNLQGGDELDTWHTSIKNENDNIKGFLKN